MSLPVRGRGLKQSLVNGADVPLRSLPVRGRGLKHKFDIHDTHRHNQSLPVRGRGLKRR